MRDQCSSYLSSASQKTRSELKCFRVARGIICPLQAFKMVMYAKGHIGCSRPWLCCLASSGHQTIKITPESIKVFSPGWDITATRLSIRRMLSVLFFARNLCCWNMVYRCRLRWEGFKLLFTPVCGSTASPGGVSVILLPCWKP